MLGREYFFLLDYSAVLWCLYDYLYQEKKEIAIKYCSKWELGKTIEKLLFKKIMKDLDNESVT